jgi:hypothetical protein
VPGIQLQGLLQLEQRLAAAVGRGQGRGPPVVVASPPWLFALRLLANGLTGRRFAQLFQIPGPDFQQCQRRLQVRNGFGPVQQREGFAVC